MLWAILGPGWLIALRYVDWGKRAIPFFIGLVCVSTMAILVGDHSRVFAIMTFPLALAYWLLNKEFLAQLPPAQVALLFLIWLVVPWHWFVGSIKGSVFFFDVGYVLHSLIGWPGISNDLGWWPFQ